MSGGSGSRPRHGGFGAFGLGAGKAQGGSDGHAELADALFVVDNQQFDFHCVAHGFPKVFSTIEISCWTRNGFSMQGVPLLASKACVSLFAVSPLIKMMRERKCGWFF